jgi:hypothetical protein
LALDANTYGTVQRVMDRLGDLFDDGEPSTIDRLDRRQIERHLDDVAAEMNALLEVYGYVAPIDSSTNEFAFEYSRTANVAGACVAVLNSMPGLAFDPESPEVAAGNRRGGFQAIYNEWKRRVRDREILAAKSVGLAGRFKVGSATDRKTGHEKKPVFTRDKFDYPGSVARLAEDDD